MKYIIFALFTFSSSVYANSRADIADQFNSRNWNYYSYKSGKEARLQDYFSEEVNSSLNEVINNFISELVGGDSNNVSLFYPELDISTPASLDKIVSELNTEKDVISKIQEWTIFKNVAETEKWSDDSGCDAENALNDTNCGRKTKSEYALNHLSSNQLQQINSFKALLINDLIFIGKNDSFVPGPEIPRLFQFLYDSRFGANLFTLGLMQPDIPLTDDVKVLRTEALRALFVHEFQDSSGKLYNSNLYQVSLDNDDCYEEEVDEVDCNYEYVKALFWDKDSLLDPLMGNLIFDPKSIEFVAKSFVDKYSQNNTIKLNEETLYKDFGNIYFILSNLYGFDNETPSIDVSFKNKIMAYLKEVNRYFLDNPSLIGLQIAKNIQKLNILIEEEL